MGNFNTKNWKKSLGAISLLGVGLFLSACSSTGAAKDAKYQKIVEEKAKDYGIDPEGVVVSSGATYYMVPIDTIHSYEEMEDQIGNYRRWLRFAFAELPRGKYDVGFYDRNDLDIWYGGFSNQDYGFDSEYYWTDEDVLNGFVNRIENSASFEEEYTNMTPEKFYEVTGIDEEAADAIRHRFHETYQSPKETVPNKAEHTYTFIPGDNINHYEKFVIGEDDCPIDAGIYSLDMTGRWGLIHVTDSADNTKCRVDVFYKNGHTDELYNYSALPTEIELDEGDIIYMKNCISTFDRIN